MASIGKNAALEKMRKYCAYQERCHKEVRQKLLRLEVYGDELEEIIYELIQENFLNEERYARSYARGKFRFKKWGRLKIIQELKRREISEYCIGSAMEEIDEDEYISTLNKLAAKKWEEYHRLKIFDRKGNTARYLINKGYEPELVWKILAHESFG